MSSCGVEGRQEEARATLRTLMMRKFQQIPELVDKQDHFVKMSKGHLLS
jgi:hypothetical protein